MSIEVNWMDPYADREGAWYRGNLHAHSSPASGCGQVPLERVLELYNEKGIDFLSVSDHRCLTEPTDDKIVLIPGTEWNSLVGEHTGVYSLDKDLLRSTLETVVHDDLLQRMAGRDALVILNHPNWEMRPHYRREELEARKNFDGIEIYNGVIERLAGYAISTDKWDFLLNKGTRVLGFASDDSHNETDIGQAWNCVRASEKTPQGILSALRKGNFYCSTGVVISDIRVDENRTVHIETENGQEIRVIGPKGLIRKVQDSSISFSLADTEREIEETVERVKGTNMEWLAEYTKIGYVRFTVYGPGSAMAWTQPFFLQIS